MLVSPEQAKILAELEAGGKLHLSLVYRGSKENAAKFTELQDKVIEALYPKPAEQKAQAMQPIPQGTASEPENTVPESEGE
jgi:pilus assembly protein CpaB